MSFLRDSYYKTCSILFGNGPEGRIFSDSVLIRHCVDIFSRFATKHDVEGPEEVCVVVKRTGQNTGLSRHSRNLLKQLRKRVKVKEIDTAGNVPGMFVFLGKLIRLDLKEILSNIPLLLPLREDTITHFTDQNFVLPLFFHKGKSVVTVHDLISFETSRKELFTGKRPSLASRTVNRFLLKAIKKADWITTVSEYTKKRLVSMTGYPPGRISVIHEGVDTKEFRRLNLKKDPLTILYVGSEMPRKNLPVLLEAFAFVKKKIPKARLVKVGIPQWPGSRKKLKKMAKDLGVMDSIVFKDYVEKLTVEYNKAAVLVHPSIYEGFGFPVLEAMACGCPVICSDKTSLPEIGGDAVLYFNPSDPKELAKKIELVIRNKKLRDGLARKGLKRARLFRWDLYAKKMIGVYKKLGKDL